jgi:exodeoxyribonuclease VII large subunit
VFSVSEVAAGLSALLEERIGRLWVSGEVINVHRAASGHVYFTLKDEAAQLRAALFRSAARRVPFDLDDGLEVRVYGELTLYPPRGDLQIIVREVEPRGVGALQLAFEQLRARLEAEGLFAEEHKRALPDAPRRVGIVTSAKGAAIHDVVSVLRERAPDVPLLLAPATVQGATAAEEIEAALRALSACSDVDVILLVRGGGSAFDLEPFNTERVARAIRVARVPVVSGVGHEVDFTIADFAADLRAPTPSAAAASVVADRAELAADLSATERRLTALVRGFVGNASAELSALRARLRREAPREKLALQRADLEGSGARLREAFRHLTVGVDARLSRAAARLEALSPLAVLGRGYAIATHRDGRVARRAEELTIGERLRLRLLEGHADVRVEATDNEDG